ncbi:MAG: DNA polymerase III subunit gamma/tau [Candidatus Omnitrophota bacterium]|jgi:DNA polymerase-3 subunit gamma/tau|nr:MAG: DNA polymerase III subunit gamma/tau [Candidatus Omnitrophota bacterium]
MSYTVFALKWRPLTFDEIVGQQHIVSTLKSAIEKNRLAHAYLFAGPRGVGKTSTARILAKSLNCKNGPTTKPCNTCPSCNDITQGRSMNVIEIDGASNRGIDEIRTLRENVKFAPIQGKYKIYIIDEVHMLTTEAFNALLKTLEEPPEFVKFIFATTQPSKVLATILSRCQRFDFRRITMSEIVEQLEKITKQEKVNVDRQVLFSIAKSSEGSLRDAESILDQLVSFSGESISLNDVISVLGLVEQDILFEITDMILNNDAQAVLNLLNKVSDEGKDLTVFLNLFIEHFRNLMVAKVARQDLALIDLPQEFSSRLSKQSESFTLSEIFSALNILISAQEMAKRFDSLRIPLEIALVRLAHAGSKEKNTIKEPEKKIKAAVNDMPLPKEKPMHAVRAKPKETPPAEENTVPEPESYITLERIKDAWQNIIAEIGKVKMSVATYLSEGSPVKCEKNVLTVSFAKNHLLHKESLEKKDNKDLVEKLILELTKARVRINFLLSKEEHKQESQESSPFLKNVLNTFKGRLIS